MKGTLKRGFALACLGAFTLVSSQATAQDETLENTIIAEATDADFQNAVQIGEGDGLEAHVGRIRVRSSEGEWQPDTARQIRRVIRRQGQQVRACFQAAHERHPTRCAGRAILVGRCEGDGCTYHVVHGGGDDEELTTCLRTASQSINFDAQIDHLEFVGAHIRIPVGYRVGPGVDACYSPALP